jgi:hypothetical protein
MMTVVISYQFAVQIVIPIVIGSPEVDRHDLLIPSTNLLGKLALKVQLSLTPNVFNSHPKTASQFLVSLTLTQLA